MFFVQESPTIERVKAKLYAQSYSLGSSASCSFTDFFMPAVLGPAKHSDY